jgi:Tfp pilus assembly pilus retraction ATPase PilT
VTDPNRILKNALTAIESAEGALRRALHAAPDSHELILAVTELRDAETNIRQALRALPDDDASNSPASR